MSSLFVKALLVSLLAVNYAQAVTKNDSTSPPSPALILDNSNFDTAQLLNPDVSGRVLGPGSGGGGNICAFSIQRVNADLLRYLLATPTDRRGKEISGLINAIPGTKYYFSKNLTLGQRKVNAINYPSQKSIIVDQEACAALEQNNFAAKMLLVHEYLGLAGIEDTNYQVSTTVSQQVVLVMNAQSKYNFLIFPHTVEGRLALAWGLVGEQLDINRALAREEKYLNEIEDKDKNIYLIDITTGQPISIVKQSKGIWNHYSIELLSDGKTGALVIEGSKLFTDIVAGYLINNDGSLSALSYAFVQNLQLEVSHMSAKLANKYKDQITDMTPQTLYGLSAENGIFKLQFGYWIRERDYVLVTEAEFEVNHESYPAKIFNIRKVVKKDEY